MAYTLIPWCHMLEQWTSRKRFHTSSRWPSGISVPAHLDARYKRPSRRPANSVKTGQFAGNTNSSYKIMEKTEAAREARRPPGGYLIIPQCLLAGRWQNHSLNRLEDGPAVPVLDTTDLACLVPGDSRCCQNTTDLVPRDENVITNAPIEGGKTVPF